jgi:1,4-alpha-glucan branching enzyme
MNNGYLSIVLHAHLPYVHHPEYEQFFEEIWLFEAITECYLPLIAMLDRLQNDAVDYRLTLSLSPTLLTMLRNPLLQSRYLRHLQKQLELAEKEVVRTRHQPESQHLAEMYRQLFHTALCSYRDHYSCDLVAAFVKHQQAGKLELITTAATHGFLPLLNVSESAVRNQIGVGLETFREITGLQPSGFWLPECAYYPGLEKILHEFGVRYFFVDTHGIMDAGHFPENAVYAPLDCGNGVAAFGRDPASSRQVWSAQEGYPGDGDYREYYRDIGFELDMDYIAPYILDGVTRINTGIKYHRVTGGDLPKAIYEPQAAQAKAKQHAEHFVSQRQAQIAALSAKMATPPLIVAPYDAELFGHWWFEGPLWLEQVLRLSSQQPQFLRTLSCGDYLDLNFPIQQAQPAASSWGEHGYSSYWLNESNDWIYPLIHKAGAELEKLVGDLQGLALNALQERALNQAVRSLLLAQASDWPFILKSGTSVEYAKKRITDHLARFNYLHDAIRKNRINERYLSALEIMDDIFPQVDFRDWRKN